MEEEYDYYGNAVEEVAFCEGGAGPLEGNRTGELAMECWNLRKTVLEQTTQNVKLKKEIKTLKNLVKSLQRSVSECEAESLAKTRDIHDKKLNILQCDKKIHELTTNNNILTSSFTRTKKLAANLQRRLDESERENQQLQEKFTALSGTMKDELRAQESIYSLEIRKLSDERDRAVREVAVQKTFVDEAAARVNDLDQSSRELKSELETQARTYSENLAHLQREQEKAYDALHARLETIVSERDTLCRRLVVAEHEQHQLMSFLLMEGLQVPELQPVSPHVVDAVLVKYPPGRSQFVAGQGLIASLSGGDGSGDGGVGESENYDEYY